MIDFLQLFLIGVLSSYGPCLVSCWPVALPYITSHNKGYRETIKSSLVFLSSKMIMYGIMASLAGLLGHLFTGWLHEYSSVIFVLSGFLIIFLGLKSIVSNAHPCKNIFNYLSGINKSFSFALLGVLVSILPCATTLAVLAYIAFTAEGLLHGALLGLAFGAGKFFSPLIPATLLAGYFNNRFYKYNTVVKLVSAIIVVVLGLRLSIMGL